MDRRITIQRFDESTNAFNEVVQDWFPLTTVWAEKEDIRDGERFSAGQIAASITTRFRVRWSRTLATVTPVDRIEFDARSYEIVAVKEIGRKRGLEFTASARVDG